jgi:4-hydroxybenzoate polyprenyltransferase
MGKTSRVRSPQTRREAMRNTLAAIGRWIVTLNTVDSAGRGRLHRFLLSARLGLWPAITLSSFAFGHLLRYDSVSTGILSLNLCCVASVAFLFNDVCDAQIDAANGIHRWSVRQSADRWLLAGTILICAAIQIGSLAHLTFVAFIGITVAYAVGIAYSLFCKRIFLLGNLVAAGLSISPALIMLFDVKVNRLEEDQTYPAVVSLLVVSFLLLLSREIRFDEFDIAGDRAGNRRTLPMFLSRLALNVLHTVAVALSLSILALVMVAGGRFSLPANLLIASGVVTAAAVLILSAYRGWSKETFYKRTRLVMAALPLSILLSM